MLVVLITFLRILLFKNICNEPELGHLSLNAPVLTVASKVQNEDEPHERLYHILL